MRSTTGRRRPRSPALRSRAPRASPRAGPGAEPGSRCEARPGSKSPSSPAMICCASASSSALHAGRRDRLVDLLLAPDVLGEEQRLERERVALRADEAELLLAGEHERPEPDDVRLAHRLAAAARTAAAAPRCRPGRGSRCGRSRSGSTSPAGTKRLISIDARRVELSSASSSASSTGTNWPFATSQPRTISSGESSISWTGHQRFCLIGVRHSRCSILNWTSDWRADDAVAGASPTGMLTRPKLIDPFQVVRMCRRKSREGRPGFALADRVSCAALPC